MKNPDMGGYQPSESVIPEIDRRASSASAKIQERIKTRFIPNMKEMGDYAERWLLGLQNDFYTLVNDPNDECGGGSYEGWTANELRELYSVLYGEEMG